MGRSRRSTRRSGAGVPAGCKGGWDGRVGLRKQPGRIAGFADGGVAAASGEELHDKTGEGFRKRDRVTADAEVHLAAASPDVVDGEAADGGDLLGVEQHEQAGDPVLEFEAGVVEEPAGVVTAGLGVCRDRR